MNPHKKPALDHPIQPLLADRYSSYSFSEEPVSDDDLRSLFEAARWSASCFNEQPWRFLVARKQDGAAWETLLSCLLEGNQVWAQHAPVLGLGLVSLRFARNDSPNRWAHHDLGLATASLALEATARGLAVHAMGGIAPDRARELCGIPEDMEPVTGIAIGRPASVEAAPEAVRDREQAPRTRRALAEFVFSAEAGKPASFL